MFCCFSNCVESSGNKATLLAEWPVQRNGERVIPAKYLHLCPFEQLTEEAFAAGRWSVSCGGAPVPPGWWTIDIRHPAIVGSDRKATCDRWILPEVFSLLFSMFHSKGVAEQNRGMLLQQMPYACCATAVGTTRRNAG